jgi:tyrosyl-tRNA synthetase
VGEDLPTFAVTPDEASEGLTVAQLFVRAGLAKSGKDAKRLIAEGGARLNDEVVLDAGAVIGAGELADTVKLTAGRKRHALVVLG